MKKKVNSSLEKERTIKAMETILLEYKGDYHTPSIGDCSLCQLYLKKPYSKCSRKCPMTAFGTMGCTYRLNPAISSSLYTDIKRDAISKIIVFYTFAISGAKRHKSVRGRNFFNRPTKYGRYLINVDEGIANTN